MVCKELDWCIRKIRSYSSAELSRALHQSDPSWPLRTENIQEEDVSFVMSSSSSSGDDEVEDEDEDQRAMSISEEKKMRNRDKYDDNLDRFIVY